MTTGVGPGAPDGPPYPGIQPASEVAHARTRAASTEKAYRRDWALFTSWCAARRATALPVDPAVAATYLRELASPRDLSRPRHQAEDEPGRHGERTTGLSPATIERRLAAINTIHRAAGQRAPGDDPRVRATISSIRRHPAVLPRRRAAARGRQIELILAGLDSDDPVDARDAALLLIGWGAALRRSELAALNLDDLTVLDEGLYVRVSGAAGGVSVPEAVVGVLADEHGACPAAQAWACWWAHLVAVGQRDGPAWRPIHRSYRNRLTIRAVRLSGRSISDIVARRAAQAGLDGDYGAHSLRRGLATEAIASGVPELAVMRHGRWRSAASMGRALDDSDAAATTNPTAHVRIRGRKP